MQNPKEIPFSYFEQNFMIVPITINDSLTKNFILDTGIGVNLISKSLCDQLKCKIKSQHTGKRMSGQEVTVPISEIASLAMGEECCENNV